MPKACTDCVEVHGDNPQEWLNKWPQGAEFREKFNDHLCDGCYDDRLDSGDCFQMDCELYDY